MHNKITILIFVFITCLSCNSDKKTASPAIPQDKEIERKVDSILNKLSLDEKIGQMTQLTLDVLGKGESIYHSYMPFSFDEDMLDTVIHKYKIGSILNTASNTPQTVSEWTDIVTRLQKEAIQATGIPVLFGVDQIHGVTYTINGTLFPQEIGMGATFNPELVYQGAKITAYESRAGNVPWTFSPTVDLGRDARWSRMWEQYGEDTHLVSVMGSACVKGYQGGNPNHIGRNNIAACLKHYLGYGAPFSGKDRTPSYIPDNELRERHFEPFLRGIEAGALSVMVNSGLNNGLPVHANYRLLTQWLKDDLNWDGVVLTDWADINNLYTRDKIAGSKKEAIKIAINAGVDMSMVPYEWTFCTYLKELVEEGEVEMNRIDDAVRRILRLKLRLGLFERPYWDADAYPEFGSEEHAKAALQAAEESITLLKNTNNILPLPYNARILISGPNANSMRTLNGGWSLSWQGEKVDVYAQKYNTILEAFTNKWGRNNIIYEPGITYKEGSPPTTDIRYWEENEPEIHKAVAAAKAVDYIVLCLGENSYCETPGNLDNLELSANQRQLAHALANTGKPVILVLNEGRPRIILDIEPKMRAIIQIYLPGNYGGDALANIISGETNPSGKLPYTYPKYPNSLITYDHKPSENLDKMGGAYDYDAVASMQWSFGYGLSYTDFSYTNISVNKNEFYPDDELVFTVDVKNNGNRFGKETVMLFTSDEVASLSPDVRRLRAFEKIALEPGMSKQVELTIHASDLAFVGNDGKWRLEKGSFGVQIGSETLNINCMQSKIWNTPNK